MLAKIWGKGKTHPLVMGIQTCIAIMEISVVVPQKAGNSCTSRSRYTTLGRIPEGLYILLQRYLLIYVHGCSTGKSQKSKID